MLKFEIVSSRTVEGVDKEKKYVAYMLQVRQDATESRVFDPDPANVERRYTHFLDLYNGLKKEYPALLNTISFPRKIVVGNFDPNLISTRCAAFESLLNLIANESRLRDAPAAIAFFQDIELKEARKLIDDGKFDQALSLLETSFKLLNKVYTDRSRVVLSVLCRIVACAGSSGGALAGPVEKWAQLALRRYEAVSDSDLLLIYIPLLHTCISIWETLGRDKARLVEELNSLRKKGMKVDSVPSLMEAVDSLDATI
ncbi:sorting nexin-21 [Vanessa tameamea]|uniref:Sorting nexin-21 n=1 Tax=Vanessa tameamea TaxID=334116 RepID=A0ABM4AZG9_VANTA|nr:sorting nexin-21 [Vanessa atalanta]XP_047544994.1 sorting nexin-21 [Vanessa atalanta]